MEKIDLEKDLILKKNHLLPFSAQPNQPSPFSFIFPPAGLSRRPVSPARTACGPHQHVGPHPAWPSWPPRARTNSAAQLLLRCGPLRATARCCGLLGFTASALPFSLSRCASRPTRQPRRPPSFPGAPLPSFARPWRVTDGKSPAPFGRCRAPPCFPSLFRTPPGL